MKKLLIGVFLLMIIFTVGCADSKEFVDKNGKTFVAEPYGWANPELKIDTVLYKPCIGNIVWDVILSETIIVPIWLTGWEFYEPVALKTPAYYNRP